jgi:transcriptional antiterminator RfaH
VVSQWYVVRTRPNAEQAASLGLERSGFRVFSPQVRAWISALSQRRLPLFPGYLFLQCDLEEQGWPSLDRQPHILGLVRFGGVTPAVPDDVIGDLDRRVREINGGGELWSRYRPGDRVRVRLGSVESLAEVVTKPKSADAKLRVLMEFLGRRVHAEIACEYVRPIENRVYLGIESSYPVPRRTRGRGRWVRGFGTRAECYGPQRYNGQTSS